ncbi:MAG: LPS-assembly protein LptD [Caulobacteraceae bacterium]
MIDLARLFDVRTRALLLAGAALLCAPVAARADEVIRSSGGSLAGVMAAQMSPSEQPLPDDGLGEKGFYLEANQVTEDDRAKAVTAEGEVEVRYRGRVMRAQSLTYNRATGVVEAHGDVQILNPDGTAQFAKDVVLDDDLRAGVALGFSTRLQNNVKIAAASAVRRSKDINELNRAIYTPCDLCKQNGEAKTPTWSISAERVTQDTQKGLIYYRNAIVRVGGVPVLYAPAFWHSDPNSKVRPGFLAPRFSASNKRGLSYEQPYYRPISSSQDLVVRPMFNTKVNPFLNAEWRKLFANGEIDARVGYTYEKEFTNSGNPIPGSEASSRSYILASGAFRLNPQWTVGFSAERASDALLFDRYDVPDVYEKRGLYATDTRRLLSQTYAVRQDPTSYVSIALLDFQGLQLDPLNPNLPERNSILPVVTPLIEARWAPATPILGGRLRLQGSAAVISRQESITVAGAPGVDSRRASAGGEWRRTFTFTNGLRAEPFALGRLDLYNVYGFDPALGVETSTRALGTVGVDVTYPLIRQAGSSTIILEPIVQAALSPNADLNPSIPNQDTVGPMFDETNLFDPNRPPGFDVYDAGARLNVGVRGSFYWGDNRQARVLAGKSIRSEANPVIPASAGYQAAESDWVVAAAASPIHGLWTYGRVRLDPDTLDVHRSEFGVNFAMSRIEGYARYLNDRTLTPSPLDPALGPRESAEAAANVYFTKNWGVTFYGQHDLQNSQWVRRDIGIVYRDECIRAEVVYHREEGSVRLGGPSESVVLRLTLATLGDPGYRGPGDW